MEKIDVIKEIKIEVPWGDELLSDQERVADDDMNIVEVKSEPEDFSFELKNQDMSNHGMIEIKDEFGKTMEEFDMSHVKSTSDCSETRSVTKKKDEKSLNSINCLICNKNFANVKSLKLHKKRIHQKKKKHQCTLCESKFAKKSNLTQHIATFCPAKFAYTSVLKRPIKTVHEGKKSWYCPKCKQLRYSERPESSRRQHAKIVIMKKHSQNTISALGGVKRKILFFSVPETMLFYHKKLEYSTICLQFYRQQTNKKEKFA